MDAPVKRRRVRRWLTIVGVVIALCGIAPCAGFWVSENLARHKLNSALDAVKLPADYKLINVNEDGNSLCLDICLSIGRRYSSPSTKDATYQVFTTALEQAGYRCTEGCTKIDTTRSMDSGWQRSDGQRLYLDVFSTADLERADSPWPTPLDPTREVHAELAAS